MSTFQPKANYVPTGKTTKAVVDVGWLLVRRYPWRSLITLVALIFSGFAESLGIAAVLPLLTIVDDPTAPPSSSLERLVVQALDWIGLQPEIGSLLLVICVAMSIRGVALYLALVQVSYTVAEISTDLRLEFTRAIMGARWGYFVGQSAGSIGNSLNTEAGRAGEVFNGVFRLIVALIHVVVYAFTALLVSPTVVVAVAVGSAALLLVFGPMVRLAREAGIQESSALTALSAQLVDMVGGIKPVKAMAREDQFLGLLEAESRKLNVAMRRSAVAILAIDCFREPIIIVFIGIGLYAATQWMGLPLESMIVMAFLFQRTVAQISHGQKVYQGLARSEAFYFALQKRMAEAASAREDISGGPVSAFAREIELRNVHLRLGDSPVLRGVDMKVPAHSMTALTGGSGGGKTTTSDVILGFYLPDSGSVLIDGEPLTGRDVLSWRAQIGYVPQEMFLFHDSIFVNVTLGDPSLTHADAERALRAAEAWDFVAAMPDGMDTSVGERGTRLSGGQRQRIAIARAIIRQPKLLVLDEPTSALDPLTEAAIGKTLRNLTGQMTVLVISHQPRLVASADVVYRVESGVAVLTQPATGEEPARAAGGRGLV